MEPLKFRNKYRSESARLKNYDYSSDGAYFVTICTNDRKHFFGEIADKTMVYSDIGTMAIQCWKQIPCHFPFVTLNEWVVMPNHIHGILIFTGAKGMTNHGNKFGPQSQNLGSVIRGFKIGVTKYARQNTLIHTLWQPRFHDRIIRTQSELNRIAVYIRHNPLKWKNDNNKPDSLLI